MTHRDSFVARCLIGAALVSLILCPSTAVAGFVRTFPVFDNPCDFAEDVDWFFGATGANPLTPPAANWVRSYSSPAARALTATLRHRDVCNAPQGVGGTFSFNLVAPVPIPPRDEIRGEAKELSHGAEIDVARLTLTVNSIVPGGTPDANINLTAKHLPAGTPFRWSVRNLDPGTTALENVVVIPSYRTGVPPTIVTGPALIIGTVAAGTRVAGRLRNVPALGALTDYSVIAQGSGTTDTTLAFLGDVDGTFSELSLGAATRLFVDDNEFLVPMLTSSMHDLFIGVDLVQWLTQPTAFTHGQVFDISGGTSPLLPGFLISASPISLGPTGFVTDSPVTEAVFARAAIDGQAVREPATLTLLGVGILVAMGYRWRWKPARSA